jgi:hypothetical protein
MNERENEVNRLLYAIYLAGFEHGSNEGCFPKHGTFDAFNRLINGESPMEDGTFYNIKEKIKKLV